MSNPLNNEIRFLKGVGEKRAALFLKLGIVTVKDLLYYFPRAYEDRTKIKKINETGIDETCSVLGTIITPIREQRIKGAMLLYKFAISDGESKLSVTLYNQKYTAEKLEEGKTYLFFGKISGNLFLREMNSPAIEEIDDIENAKGKILPLYSLINGFNQRIIQKAMQSAIALLPENVGEPLPDELRKKWKLAHLRFALEYIHKPNDFFQLNAARRRFVFEELLILQLGLIELKKRNRGYSTRVLDKKVDMNAFYSALPFSLTNAQIRAIDEALQDMEKSIPMSRIVQGDVGCGKTMVAAALAFFVIKNGYQVSMMAPTEILAKQHYETFSAIFSKLNLKCGLLTGSMSEKAKNEVIKAILEGETHFVVGTHSLIEDKVAFKNLSLVITDEQHRFGVRQRARLAQKGNNPHILVMSATPIPRTLGLILYGDLDISIIDELPPGRQKVDTFLADEEKRERVYHFLGKELAKGRQAYIVCPLVEEGDKKELKDVENFSAEIAEKYLNNFKVGFIHGRLKGVEKERIMSDFYENKINALVATTVIEVGVNVPNATMMIIENAERFGLSQLHQLRGRVGRGAEKSYCILLSNASSNDTIKRLTALCETNDGFIISQKDLEIRGAGDFFGERQHGLPPLKIANIVTDMEVLKSAQIAAREIIKEDIHLELPKNKKMKTEIKKLFSDFEIFN
jgi:ATP-dependent DNA helicase RecG